MNSISLIWAKFKNEYFREVHSYQTFFAGRLAKLVSQPNDTDKESADALALFAGLESSLLGLRAPLPWH